MERIDSFIDKGAGCAALLEAAEIVLERRADGVYCSDVATWQQIVAAYDVLAEKKAAKCGAIDALRDHLIAAGFADTVTGKTFQIDPESQGKIHTKGTIAGLMLQGLVSSAAQDFIARDNTIISLEPGPCLAWALRCGNYVSQVLLNARVLKNSALAAADEAALEAIDINVGWPG